MAGAFVSPATLYPWTLISYSYGKVLLAPGQRLGYLAISPLMPQVGAKPLREAMFSAQMALGWCFPNAVMQYAVPELDRLSIDQAAIARRRDVFMAHLAPLGFDVLPPEGTFYLWSRWPNGDPRSHVERAGGSRRLRHAGPHDECGWLFPHQPHGVRRDDRPRCCRRSPHVVRQAA